MIENYKVIKLLGRGAFGSVFLVQDPDGKLFAAKVMPLKLDQL
jgi:serine/threonine protein kinase